MIKKQITYSVLYFFFMTQIIYSAESNTVVATINVGVTPDGIAITPDSKFAYVANNNNYSISTDSTNTYTWYTVSVLDLTNNTLKQTIFDPTFYQPFTVTINPAGTVAYITNSAGATITKIRLSDNTVIGVITGFDGPSGMVITPDGATAYVNNYGGPILGSGNGHTISVVNLNTDIIVATIDTNLAPAALAITPDGAFVYVANYTNGNTGTGTVQAIRTSDNTIVATIPGFSGPFGIAITPNGKYAYVTNFGSNNFTPISTTVSAIDLNNNTIIATITLGIQPAAIAITPDSKYVYASNFNSLYAGANFSDLTMGQGTVNIIDVATNTVLPPTIAVGQSPSHMAIASSGAFGYVTNFASNTVSVIALPTFTISAQGCKIYNRFLGYTDIVNKITWSATGELLPVRYAIYRDAELTQLAATVSAQEPLVFYDHNRKPNVTYTYYITGTNAFGTTSAPIAVTVTARC